MLNADPPPPIGAMLDELLGATESQVLRIVELAEAAKDDAIREDVLAPLRPRLAQLKPGRKLRLARLLFTPLDGLIVPAALWRPGQPAVPRDALMPIAAGVRAALGAEAVAIEQMIAGHTTLRQDIDGQAGALLWPRAAEFGGPVKLIGADPEMKGGPATGPANRALGTEGGFDYIAVSGAGHLLQIEQPALCRDILRDFLAHAGVTRAGLN